MRGEVFAGRHLLTVEDDFLLADDVARDLAAGVTHCGKPVALERLAEALCG